MESSSGQYSKFHRNGLIEVETLGVIDAPFAQQVESGLVRHEFCDRLPSRNLGRIDDRMDDGLVDFALGDPLDESAVDLDQVERDLLQVAEPAVTGTEVVECTRAPGLAQPGYCLLYTSDAADE